MYAGKTFDFQARNPMVSLPFILPRTSHSRFSPVVHREYHPRHCGDSRQTPSKESACRLCRSARHGSRSYSFPHLPALWATSGIAETGIADPGGISVTGIADPDPGGISATGTFATAIPQWTISQKRIAAAETIATLGFPRRCGMFLSFVSGSTVGAPEQVDNELVGIAFGQGASKVHNGL